MKKIIKWICIIACAFLVLGIALVGIGVALGGKTNWSMNYNDGSFNTMSDEDLVSNAFGLDAFSAIEAGVSSVDFKMVRGDSYGIEYTVYESNVPTIDVKDGKLYVQVPKNEAVYFNVTSHKDKEYIILTVPDNDEVYDMDLEMLAGESQIERINVKGRFRCSSGELSINETKAAENLTVELPSGEFSIKDSIFEDFDVEIGSGEFNANDIETVKFKFKASSGEANLKNIKAEEVFTDITSGDINAENVECKVFDHTGLAGSLSVETLNTVTLQSDISSGDVEIKDLTADTIISESTSGSVYFEVNGKQEDYGYDLHALSGDIECGDMEVERKLVMGADKEKQITVDITSGDTEIEFK